MIRARFPLTPPCLDDPPFDRLAHWARLWRLPGLEQRVTVAFSHNMRRSLGRCLPCKGRIRLNSILLRRWRPALEEVLCHELAHAAVFELHGGQCRPHGPEWVELMEKAGFPPRLKIFLDQKKKPVEPRRRPALVPGPAPAPAPVAAATMVYVHRCPVCSHVVRLARRPNRNWRCAACRAAGRRGKLRITRQPDPQLPLL